VALTAIFAYALKMINLYHVLLLFTSLFAVTANLHYWIFNLKGKIKISGASVAHVGFGLILAGALISTSQKIVISQNTSGIDIESLGESFKNGENIMLSQGDTLRMGEYFVTYQGKEKKDINIYYNVDYLKQDREGNYTKEFSLAPLVQTNPRMGPVAEPGTMHFLTRDVFTYVTYAEIEEKEDENDEYKAANENLVAPGDTLFASNSIITLDEVTRNLDAEKYQLQEGDLAVKAKLTITDINKNIYTAEPFFILRGNYIIPVEAENEELGLKFLFDRIETETGKLKISISEKRSNSKDFIIMRAIIFPYINILWMGCIIMIIGTVIAIFRRLSMN
jgi:cytochrome c-type biogenesis protein CcmF